MSILENKKINIPTILYFVVAIIIISYFFPRQNGLKYSYDKGKPWKYELLTAPFDFSIYKAAAGVSHEKDSLMRDYKPYYLLDKSIAAKSVSDFEKDALSKKVDESYIRFVKRELLELYKSGIVTTDDFERVGKYVQKKLNIREDDGNIYTSKSISSFLTSKQAYLKLINQTPVDLDTTVIQSLNVNNYITENVIFDAKTSKKAEEDLMQQISSTNGRVQSGQRIIDRGEIVDAQTFDILNSLNRVYENKKISNKQEGWHLAGGFLLITVFIMSFMTYLIFFRRQEFNNQRNVIFMLLMIVVFCVLTALFVTFKLNSYIYVIPFAIVTILIRTFIDSRTAMMVHFVTIFICALMVPLPSEFLFIQIPVGFACIFSLKDLSERSQLIRSSFFILMTYVLVYISFTLCQEGSITNNWKIYLFFLFNFIFLMFSYLLVYMCEKAFGFISGVSLIELSNVNKPPLSHLSEQAPGTFQHSMQVSNLATAAAVKIGANASLVRTGAMYHDIGKMIDPSFFTENKLQGMSPLSELSHKESAKIIIGHVAEGVRIAHKYGIPQQIIDFIETHHGTGIARYFYNSYKNENPDEDVDISLFSYPGPNPFSKETAILMMADTVEAASRSLTEYTNESISALVEKLINTQVSDGLFKNAPITFQDIEIVKATFCEKLSTIYHTRISYPELKTNKTNE